VSERIVEADGSARLTPERVAADNRRSFVVRRLMLDHRYHDDDRVQGADFTVTLPNGLVVSGKLDARGTLIGVPARVEVRSGPDQRAFERGRPAPSIRDATAASDANYAGRHTSGFRRPSTVDQLLDGGARTASAGPRQPHIEVGFEGAAGAAVQTEALDLVCPRRLRDAR
jgi:hypothetical protein